MRAASSALSRRDARGRRLGPAARAGRGPRMTARNALLAATCRRPLALAGCSRAGEIVVEQGVGITALRSVCPAVGVPDYTGDVTLFRRRTRAPPTRIDVTAAITNVRSQCNDAGDQVYTTATLRRARAAARHARRAQRAAALFLTVRARRQRGGRQARRHGDAQLRRRRRSAPRRAAPAAPMSTAPRRRCPPTSASGSPASAAPATRTRRSIR